MDTENNTHNLWEEYLVIGLMVAVLLVILGYQKDIVYQIIPVIVLMFITGIKESIKALLDFVRHQWLLTAFTAVYAALFLAVSKDAESAKYIITVFFLVFAGSCVVRRCDGEPGASYRKLWVLMLALVLYGISKIIRDSALGAFMDHTVELTAVVAFLMITVLYLEEKRYRIFGIIVSALAFLLLLRNNALKVSNIMSIRGILTTYMGAGPRWILFGRGQLALYTEFADQSENTFGAFLFDYGLVALALYLAALIYAIFLVVKSEDKLLKKQAIFVCAMIIMSLLYSAEYWGSMMFMIFTGIGVMLGRAGYIRVKEKSDG